jgi:hypothetical protein
MENKGLLFIPDISGFSRFVTETEISHSRIIIQELLETLINANQIDLEVSEIEGDAILFYRFGEAPDIKELYHQVEKMFCEFHRYLSAYDRHRFCQCKACVAATDLTLKVISHYGEFTHYNVKNFNKLIGKDVIVAHQLLKNDIAQHEYWLVTKDLAPGAPPQDLKDWMKWDMSGKQTETGEIKFHYTQLGKLKNELPPDPPLDLELRKKKKMFSLTKDYEGHIITMFHATGNFTYRNQWQEGVKAMEEISHFLPRIGTKARRISENGEITTVYASSYSFNPARIEFSETDEGKDHSMYYILEAITDNITRVTIEYYINKGIVNEIAFNLRQKAKIKAQLERSMERLAPLVKQLNIPTDY